MSGLPPLPQPINPEEAAGKTVQVTIHEMEKLIIVFTDDSYTVIRPGTHDMGDGDHGVHLTTAYVPDHEELWNWDLISLGTYLAHKAAAEANEAARREEARREQDLQVLQQMKLRMGLQDLTRLIQSL